jgi:3-phosphoshikimate 1-carboxyvinyltransferase
MIRVPGDKSVAHRALILASVAQGESRVRGVPPSGDLKSTAGVLRALGAPVPPIPDDGGEMTIPGRGLRGLQSPEAPLDCGNSGTTSRLILGLLAGLPVEAVVTGDDSLRSRPMDRVTIPLSRMGATFGSEGGSGRLPLRVRGGSLHGVRHVSPVASAQVKSALLLAGLAGGVSVEVTEPGRSRDHSERMLRGMGAQVEEGPVDGEGRESHGGWRVALARPPVSLDPLDLTVPGDFSSAAFFLVLGLLHGAGPELRIPGVGLNPTRTGLLAALEAMGARIRVENEEGAEDPAREPMGDLVVEPGELVGVGVGGEVIPSLIDELPALAVAATRARGVTEIRDAAELRVKEADRIRALAENLSALGVRVEELPDGLRIHGSQAPLEGTVPSHGDHRIAMAFGVLGALPDCEVHVDDPGAADVSFPGFWDLLRGMTEGEAEGSGGPAGAWSSGVGPGTASSGADRVRTHRDEPGDEDRGARPPVVTIDGPAGSGKSTTAQEVARRLGFRHLDSGALYRALTLAVMESGVPEEEWDTLDDDVLRRLDIRMEPRGNGFRVLLDGRDPGDALRSPEVTSRVSRLAGIPAVRRRLLDLQRDVGRRGGVVTDGRDMGTVVFPYADLKVFLTASLEERARRRLLQEDRDADPEAVSEEALRIQARDARDSGRTVSPLRRPDGALVLDTTDLTFEEQVDRIARAVEGLTRDDQDD